ncbi:hypothetical protein SNE40_005558 [Patella caerulea]|uniref:Uncharacterized protein n=1 Tax=Patella caerulea TaxID=87958 RepID=A0AAN8QBU1_PATCE
MLNITYIPTEECTLDQPYCNVERLETKGKLTKLKRGCSSECKAGCETTLHYTRCRSCCIRSYCNLDNSVQRCRTCDIYVILTVWVAMVVRAA